MDEALQMPTARNYCGIYYRVSKASKWSTVKWVVKNPKSGKASGPAEICSDKLKWGTVKLFRNPTIVINIYIICLNEHPVL